MLSISDLSAALQSLSVHRPVFHSEADFQHALSWELHLRLPSLKVRLEVPMTQPKGKLDVKLIDSNMSATGIELKLVKESVTTVVSGEQFKLPSTIATDASRYCFWKDVSRIESWIRLGALQRGFAVLLTNASECWTPRELPETNHDAFRFHEGSIRAGSLDWRRPPASAHLWPPLKLIGTYLCRWTDYARIDTGSRGLLRTLVVEIVNSASTPVHN